MTAPTTTHPRHILAGYALGFLGVLAFSLTLPMTRIAVSGLDPVTVAVWRGLIAGLTALAILVVLRPARPVGAEWIQLSLCAFGTVFGFPLFTTLAMETISASHGAVVVGLLPLATAAIGVLVSEERPSIGFWAASVAGTAVTLVFVLKQTEGGLAFGHLYLLLAVITAGVGYAFGGKLSRRLRGWVVACWSLAISMPLLMTVAWFIPPMNIDASASVLGAFFYLALISQLAGFFAWYRGMALAGIARVSQIQLLQLFMTFGFAVVFLGEPWDTEVLAFGGVIVGLIWVSARLRIGARTAPK
jgi:drug/metabolite transporter (DMT)-like permease